MHLFTACLAVLGAFATVSATPTDKRDILSYRSWDLRLFSDAIPVCSPDNSNLNLSIMHNYGRYGRDCSSIDTEKYNATNVKSLSWKTTQTEWLHFCMWSTLDCSGGQASLLGSITDRWSMCYPYNGFVAYSVVDNGTSCI
ncbi:hypothetical protein N7492_007622 [Penicillium capsulatum]|uniref:Ecp2 effector protein domain-containing protein n=1 Tax=Penicillium capsulatum TaxID=69766 RepID=A0A9W9LLG2_9EURO|nr:hypothetical protein N7492_007622 [Penicillium capsulatum]